MGTLDGSAEPPIYRPFALLAFGAALVAGAPLGVWMLAWLHLGAPAPPPAWWLLHAHVQIFGFFGTLIAGVAQHLLPRFTGRPVEPSPIGRALAVALGAALALRVVATGMLAPGWLLVAALVQAASFGAFAWWVWQALDPPPLALLRRHLTASVGWLVLACSVEAGLRWRAMALGLPLPDLGGMRAVHAMGIFGGVIGWVLGVLLRAGPMFVPSWRVPAPVAGAMPWILGLGVALVALGEAGRWSPRVAMVLPRVGELVALSAVGAVMITGGVFRAVRGALPMVARSREETRIFRLAGACGAAALVGTAAAAVAAASGIAVHAAADALRHLVTIGFLASVVVAMAFRLVPVLEQRPLPWPRLRTLAFWALLGSVLLRTAEVLTGHGWPGIGPWVVVSGALVWIALAAVGLNLVGALVSSPRDSRPAA